MKLEARRLNFIPIHLITFLILTSALPSPPMSSFPSIFDFETLPDRRGTGSLKWDRYAGRDVLPMWVADMDFVSPPCVVEALRQRVEHGVFGYTVPYEEVTEATLAYLRERHGVTARREWIVWFPGLVPALNVLCRSLGAEQDEVLTATPVYAPFLTAPVFSGRKILPIPLTLDADRWLLDLAAMERAITPRTRLLILCNPHNPVGRVFTETEVRAVADLCRRKGLVLCSDEIHCDLILDASRHVCAATLAQDFPENLVVMLAPSKTYNTPGLACAYAVIPDEKLRRRVQDAARGLITEINAMGYTACAAAYRDGEPWRQQLLAHLRANRDFLYDSIRAEMPRIRLRPMEATSLAWLDVRELGLTDPSAFFEKGGVGLSDGRAFGPGGEGFVRLNFGCPRARLVEALERMKRALRAA